MTWLRTAIVSRWQWLVLNGVALGTFVYVLTQGDSTLSGTREGIDSMLATGEWGVRWLLVSLAMAPLHTYLRWREALKLRKSAGLWAFAFGMAHFVIYARERWLPNAVGRSDPAPWAWLVSPLQPYIVLGLVSLLILSALAITSNRPAMRQLGKGWKRLHRLVYVAGVAILTHGMLASMVSKRMFVRDPNAVAELQVYAGILAVLLIVRVPQVRTRVLRLSARGSEHVVVGVAPRVVPTAPGRHLPQAPGLRDPYAQPLRTETLRTPASIPVDAPPKDEREPVG